LKFILQKTKNQSLNNTKMMIDGSGISKFNKLTAKLLYIFIDLYEKVQNDNNRIYLDCSRLSCFRLFFS
jgi:hypothetical protein